MASNCNCNNPKTSNKNMYINNIQSMSDPQNQSNNGMYQLQHLQSYHISTQQMP